MTTKLTAVPGTYYAGIDRPFYASQSMITKALTDAGFTNVQWYPKGTPPPVNPQQDPNYSPKYTEWIKATLNSTRTLDLPAQPAWLVGIPFVQPAQPKIATPALPGAPAAPSAPTPTTPAWSPSWAPEGWMTASGGSSPTIVPLLVTNQRSASADQGGAILAAAGLALAVLYLKNRGRRHSEE